MVMCRGCALRTLVRSAEGQLQAWLLLTMMGVAAFAMTRTVLFNDWVAPWITPLSVDLERWGWSSQGMDAALGFSGLHARVGAWLALSVERIRLTGG